MSDEFIVPLCRVHHRELHLSGNESAWWHRLNIDPLPVALKLWQQSRADGELFSSIEGVTQAPAAKTPDVSAPDQSGTGRDPNVHPGSARRAEEQVGDDERGDQREGRPLPSSCDIR